MSILFFFIKFVCVYLITDVIAFFLLYDEARDKIVDPALTVKDGFRNEFISTNLTRKIFNHYREK